MKLLQHPRVVDALLSGFALRARIEDGSKRLARWLRFSTHEELRQRPDLEGVPLRAYTLKERPDLVAEVLYLHYHAWPRFTLHSPVLERHGETLFTVFADYQIVLCDEHDRPVAVGHTIPFVWDGTVEGLPVGFDAVIEQGVADHEAGKKPNAVSALAAVVARQLKGKHLSPKIIQCMKDLMAGKGYTSLLAPVRPSRKSEQPRCPIEEYAQLKNGAGEPFDPWVRVHSRLGARTLKLAPRSTAFSAPIKSWERWTGLSFPTSGTYVIPEGLTPLVVDRERGVGHYEEPNIWMQHPFAEEPAAEKSIS